MVNSASVAGLTLVQRVVGAYVMVTLGTLAALVVLSMTAPGQATPEAWVHGVIVGAFAVVLAMRVRAARRGSAAALRAVTIIGAVLLVVNLVEAALPSVFPAWMRAEMVAIAALLLTLVVLTVRAGRIGSRRAGE
jgi:hypothetical protein